MSTHRTLAGGWATCHDRSTCASPIHVEMRASRAEQLPAVFLELLAEAADPPTAIIEDTGAKVWRDETGQLHRDYDLPAVINPNGIRLWFQHGERHREGNKFAILLPDGRGDQWEHGVRLSNNFAVTST